MHDLPLITTIAAAFTAAWLLGLLTQKLGLSPIVGYLLAGVLIGPYTPGFVGDVGIAQQLAEVGVILLMFGVGLHFHLKDLLAVKSVAVPGAIGQSLVATGLAVVVFSALGVPVKSGAILGIAMSVASTVVLMRVLMDSDSLHSPQGHVAVGWLLVEDIFTVVVLVLIPILGEGDSAHGEAATAGHGLWVSLGIALLKLLALVAIVMVGGSRVIPWVLVQVARLRSRELFTLTILVFSIAIAAGAYYFFGASMALGAFLAGMVVAQSPVSHQAAADALPMRDAFAVIFFVSVGMLVDPMIVLREPLMILAALGIILIAKPLAAMVIVALLGHSARTALTVGLGLAQIGEFSFIVSDLASHNGLMTDRGHSVLVASAILSITINPIIFRWINPIENWLRRRPKLWALLNGRAERRLQAAAAADAHDQADVDPDRQLAIVVGFGPVGRSVHRLLRDAGMATVVIDMNMDTVSELNRQGFSAVFGDATHESILEQAGMRRASHLVLTLPHSAHRVAVVTAARDLNSEARVLVRAHYLREREELERAGASAAVFEEAEAAVALARLVLADTGERRDVVERKLRNIRLQLILEDMATVRSQRIRNFMIPWTGVRRLSAGMSRGDVRRQIATHTHTHWPVIDPRTGALRGVLVVRDLIADATGGENWQDLIRPLQTVHPEDALDSTLRLMQREGQVLCIVEDGGVPVGIVTLQDILDGVVGRIKEESQTGAIFSLREAVAAGAVIPQLVGHTPEQVIAELAAAIPAHRLPPGTNVAELALAREREVSTDLGSGVAVPHARCAGLKGALVVVGRSTDGILFSPPSGDLVHLVFLFVTPVEQPNLQLELLAELARIAGDGDTRDRLLRAGSEFEILDALSESVATP